jgi:hypothetical protein
MATSLQLPWTFTVHISEPLLIVVSTVSPFAIIPRSFIVNASNISVDLGLGINQNLKVRSNALLLLK